MGIVLRKILSRVAAAWEIYLLLCLSIFTIIDGYAQFTSQLAAEDAITHFQATLGYMISMLALLSLYLLRRDPFSFFNAQNKTAFKHRPIEQAIREATCGRKYFETVRILASTTANIQPMLMMNTGVRIKKCTVIVTEQGEDKPTLANRVSTFVDAWVDNYSMGRIEQLDIRGYKHMPLLYLVILDDAALVLGFLSDDQKLNVRMDVGHPIMIENTNFETQNLIEKWSIWFDDYASKLNDHRDFKLPVDRG